MWDAAGFLSCMRDNSSVKLPNSIIIQPPVLFSAITTVLKQSPYIYSFNCLFFNKRLSRRCHFECLRSLMFLVVNVIQTDETSFIVFLSNCSLVGYFFKNRKYYHNVRENSDTKNHYNSICTRTEQSIYPRGLLNISFISKIVSSSSLAHTISQLLLLLMPSILMVWSPVNPKRTVFFC